MRLIVRKEYDSITVQDLLDEADVGRSTFYAHYAGKDELLRRGFERLREELTAVQAEPSAAEKLAPLSFSLVMFTHAEQYKENYRAMVGGRGGAIVRAEVRRVLLALVEPELNTFLTTDLPRELVARFLVDSFQSVLSWWLERRPELPAEAVHDMFRALVFSRSSSAAPALR